MIIRIEELPQGQTIKDISINISFEDGQIKNITNTSTSIEPIKVVETPKKDYSKPAVEAVNCVNTIAPLETNEAINLVPEIDLSNREHKVDTSMVDESF